MAAGIAAIVKVREHVAWLPCARPCCTYKAICPAAHARSHAALTSLPVFCLSAGTQAKHSGHRGGTHGGQCYGTGAAAGQQAALLRWG